METHHDGGCRGAPGDLLAQPHLERGEAAKLLPSRLFVPHADMHGLRGEEPCLRSGRDGNRAQFSQSGCFPAPSCLLPAVWLCPPALPLQPITVISGNHIGVWLTVPCPSCETAGNLHCLRLNPGRRGKFPSQPHLAWPLWRATPRRTTGISLCCVRIGAVRLLALPAMPGLHQSAHHPPSSSGSPHPVLPPQCLLGPQHRDLSEEDHSVAGGTRTPPPGSA